MIVPTVNGKTVKIMPIKLNMNFKGALSGKHGIPESPSIAWYDFFKDGFGCTYPIDNDFYVGLGNTIKVLT